MQGREVSSGKKVRLPVLAHLFSCMARCHRSACFPSIIDGAVLMHSKVDLDRGRLAARGARRYELPSGRWDEWARKRRPVASANQARPWDLEP
jgi:hypothetical protein